MSDFGSRNRRDSITSRLRLREWDYSTPGFYFVTICCQNREHRFGCVSDKVMHLSEPGLMVNQLWSELSSTISSASVDAFVTMPNHIHVLIELGLSSSGPSSLVDVIHWYKSKSTTLYIHGVKEQGWRRFEGRLWQEKYHDHIVRNDRELAAIREYITNNPAKW